MQLTCRAARDNAKRAAVQCKKRKRRAKGLYIVVIPDSRSSFVRTVDGYLSDLMMLYPYFYNLL